VQELITEARQRVENIRRQTAQLRQEQISYAQEIETATR
jgi:cobalamin biosynthesis protein CobD/CbiB